MLGKFKALGEATFVVVRMVRMYGCWRVGMGGSGGEGYVDE